MNTTAFSLKEQYEKFIGENPKVRIRDAAKQLGTSEVQLVALGENNTALTPAFEQILREIPKLGYVMALTRNDYAVHERKGVYSKAGFSGLVGLVVSADIDLRLFMTNWVFAFAVHENERKSLQFFGKDGEAIHKIYLTDQSDVQAYDALVGRYKVANQQADIKTEIYMPKAAEKPDTDIDVDAFRSAWLDLRDTHDFFGLLKKYGLSRIQAFRLAPEGYATQMNTAYLKRVLETVSARDLEIMVFIGNRGCIQIHTGKAKRLLQTGPWFNVLDPEFNMHLREDGIASVWLVKKPTDDGIVTSIEVFDEAGELIVQFFGKRKPGIPEREDWREVVLEQEDR